MFDLKLLFETFLNLFILDSPIFYVFFFHSQYFQRTNRLADVNRRLKSQIWSSVVTIVLVEAKNLLPMDIEGLSDPYVKFRYKRAHHYPRVLRKNYITIKLILSLVKKIRVSPTTKSYLRNNSSLNNNCDRLLLDLQSWDRKVQVKSGAQDLESRLVGAIRSSPIRRSLFRAGVGGDGMGSR